MKIEYDKESGALYFRLREGKPDHAEDLSEKADVYAHVDSEGRVLAVEALSSEDLIQATEESGGSLYVPDVWNSPFMASRDSFPEMVASLSARKQEVLHFLYMEGLSDYDVAERLGISVSEAYRLHRQALEDLRDSFQRKEHRSVNDAALEALLSSL